MADTPSSKPTPSKSPAASKKKSPKALHPIALHIVQSYDVVYKLSFLLNKKKSLMGSPKTGFALSCPAIRRIQKLGEGKNNILTQLPKTLYEESKDQEVNQKLNRIVGHSILEVLSEPIRRYLKELIEIVKSVNAEDESNENKVVIITLFKQPVQLQAEGNPAKTSKITPYQLLQQLQKSVAILRQRLMLELDTIQQLRNEWLTEEDCFHALCGTNNWEIKGRITTAREILQSLQGMLLLKKSNFQEEFHPKITLERAIQNMQAWGPGTPPRMFHVKEDSKKGKFIQLNEKLKEQLSILKEATHDALGYEYHFPSTNERLERIQAVVKEFYQPPEEEGTGSDEETDSDQEADSEPPQPTNPEESDAESSSFSENAKKVIAKESPVSGPGSVRENNALSYEEILQFYAKQKEESIHKFLAAMYFEAKTANYLNHYTITTSQAQDLRGIFTTLQMDLSQSIDLFLIEAQKVVKSIRKVSKKIGVEANSQELLLIAQPGEKTQKLVFRDAIAHWTEMYVAIVQKYLLIEHAHQKKLITQEESFKSLCAMEAPDAISYLMQLEALVEAQQKGYITEEQRERYLNPQITSAEKLKSILAFFGAIEKFNFPDRCAGIIKGFQDHIAHFQAIIEKNPAQQKVLKDPIKDMEAVVSATEPNVLIQELLNAEIFDMEPKNVYLFMERVLVCLEMKKDLIKFQSANEQILTELVSKLSGGVDVPEFNKIFYMPEESGQPSLFAMLNRINGTPEACAKNVFHKNDNTTIRECVLRSFDIEPGALTAENAVNIDNVKDILGIEYCVNIMVSFQHSFMNAARRVFALDVETKHSPDQVNQLGVKPDRVQEMKNQCECILDKQVPIQFALKNLAEIWQTLERDKIVAKEAKFIESLQQKLDGNVAGGLSLYKRLGNNPENVEAMGEYRIKAQEAYMNYQKNLQNIAERLRALNRDSEIPKNILEYQRQVLSMERSIYQTVQELKEGHNPQVELLTQQVKEKQKRIHKYKKILEKFRKENPGVELPT